MSNSDFKITEDMSRPERIQWGELRKYMTKLSLKQPTSHFFLKKNKLYIDNRQVQINLLLPCYFCTVQVVCLEFRRWRGSGTHNNSSPLFKCNSTAKNEYKTKIEILKMLMLYHFKDHKFCTLCCITFIHITTLLRRRIRQYSVIGKAHDWSCSGYPQCQI